jgi:predicted transcriptional regulator
LGRLVRNARGPISQETFAGELGISQEMLSRYERGRVKPPTDVVAKCWEVVEKRGSAAPPPASELALRVQRVGGSEFVAVREAIARLIDISVGRGRPGRRPR